MTTRLTLALAATLALAGCGGGSGGQQAPPPASQPPSEPAEPGAWDLHVGELLEEDNSDFLRTWYASPEIDLPRDGQYGLAVERPAQGGAAFPRITFSSALRDRLEPDWRQDNNAQARLEFVSKMIWILANQAYMQWTRHLDYDPGSLTLQVGSHGSLTCHNLGIACYVEGKDAVVLNDDWIADNYEQIKYSARADNPNAFWAVYDTLFIVLSHEAGHQFGYTNPRGTRDGCGNSRCHAPYGSRSVISYDHREGRSIRYYVTAEDIRHVPNATWKGDDFDPYFVGLEASPSSLDGWGVAIGHRFSVDGWTSPGRLWGGNLSIVDEISGLGWVSGTSSEDVSLTATATWSGEDNFLGVDMNPNYLGALLRADANLRYTFGSRPNLNLRVNNFEAHYARNGVAGWHDHSFPADGFGDFRYNMDCTSNGCSGYSVEAKWYADDAGDPSGWVGGVVSDEDAEYAGSFVAEKD